MSTKELLQEYVEAILEAEATSIRRTLQKCESPIEELLLAAFMHRGFRWSGLTESRAWDEDLRAQGFIGSLPFMCVDDSLAVLTIQPVIENYRADFALVTRHTRSIVECDGHDFHERTKAQASRDKSRDRWFTRHGWRVFRFTGSDIVRDARGCVDELLEAVHALEIAEAERRSR